MIPGADFDPMGGYQHDQDVVNLGTLIDALEKVTHMTHVVPLNRMLCEAIDIVATRVLDYEKATVVK